MKLIINSENKKVVEARGIEFFALNNGDMFTEFPVSKVPLGEGNPILIKISNDEVRYVYPENYFTECFRYHINTSTVVKTRSYKSCYNGGKFALTITDILD